jgi:hypothetical protein
MVCSESLFTDGEIFVRYFVDFFENIEDGNEAVVHPVFARITLIGVFEGIFDYL